MLNVNVDFAKITGKIKPMNGVVGGPAVCGRDEWGPAFIKEMKKRGTSLDFFSWHKYTYKTEKFEYTCGVFKKALDEAGYADTELILDEWNYVENWNNQPDSFRKQIIMRDAYCI